MRLKRLPRLLRSDSATVPFACGLIVRTVVVPGELIDQLPADQLDVVLAHELAHHRRHDLWVNAAQTLTFVAFWFHPVYWWLTRTIRQVREQCCDDLLLATRLTSADICCDTLLTVAARPASPRTTPVAISMAHPLASRLQRLLDDSQKRSSRLSVSGWILTGAAALLIWPGLRLATESTLLISRGAGATTQPTPSKSVEISGSLMDESGSPIPGADVYLVRRNPFSRRLEDRDTLAEAGSDRSNRPLSDDGYRRRAGGPLALEHGHLGIQRRLCRRGDKPVSDESSLPDQADRAAVNGRFPRGRTGRASGARCPRLARIRSVPHGIRRCARVAPSSLEPEDRRRRPRLSAGRNSGQRAFAEDRVPAVRIPRDVVRRSPTAFGQDARASLRSATSARSSVKWRRTILPQSPTLKFAALPVGLKAST